MAEGGAVKEYKSEANIQSQIMMALSEAGCLILRNNVGAWKDKSGRWIKYGVGGVGGSDLIGISPTGAFMAIECKTKTGTIRDGQREFIWLVRKMGGLAGIARSVDDAMKILAGEHIGC